MSFIKLNILFLLVLFVEGITAQLSNQINQYMVYQPLVNFSAASSYNSVTGALYYRNQWTGFTGAPEGYGLMVSIPVLKKNSTIPSNSTFGIGALRDQIGVHKNDALELHYAYRLQINRKSLLSFSLSPQVRFLTANFNTTISTEALDPTLSKSPNNKIAPNFKFGTYYYRKNFYFGFATRNLLNNNLNFNSSSSSVETSFDFNKINYFIHTGYQFDVNKKNSLILSALLKESQGASLHYNINAMWSYMNGQMGLGSSYRSTKEIVFIARFKIYKQFSLAYAYQYSLSKITNYENGSHEIMFVYDVKSNKKMIRIVAPRF